MSNEIKEAAEKIKKLLKEVHEIISHSPIGSAVQTEVKSVSRLSITVEEQYLRNVKIQLEHIK